MSYCFLIPVTGMRKFYLNWFSINVVNIKIPLFALTGGWCSGRRVSGSFTVVVRPLSACLMKPNFFFDLSHQRSTTVSLETRNPFNINIVAGPLTRSLGVV